MYRPNPLSLENILTFYARGLYILCLPNSMNSLLFYLPLLSRLILSYLTVFFFPLSVPPFFWHPLSFYFLSTPLFPLFSFYLTCSPLIWSPPRCKPSISSVWCPFLTSFLFPSFLFPSYLFPPYLFSRILQYFQVERLAPGHKYVGNYPCDKAPKVKSVTGNLSKGRKKKNPFWKSVLIFDALQSSDAQTPIGHFGKMVLRGMDLAVRTVPIIPVNQNRESSVKWKTSSSWLHSWC